MVGGRAGKPDGQSTTMAASYDRQATFGNIPRKTGVASPSRGFLGQSFFGGVTPLSLDMSIVFRGGGSEESGSFLYRLKLGILSFPMLYRGTYSLVCARAPAPARAPAQGACTHARTHPGLGIARTPTSPPFPFPLIEREGRERGEVWRACLGGGSPKSIPSPRRIAHYPLPSSGTEGGGSVAMRLRGENPEPLPRLARPLAPTPTYPPFLWNRGRVSRCRCPAREGESLTRHILNLSLICAAKS